MQPLKALRLLASFSWVSGRSAGRRAGGSGSSPSEELARRHCAKVPDHFAPLATLEQLEDIRGACLYLGGQVGGEARASSTQVKAKNRFVFGYVDLTDAGAGGQIPDG